MPDACPRVAMKARNIILLLILIVFVGQAISNLFFEGLQSTLQKDVIKRKRRSLQSIRAQYGDLNFKRAYRMTWRSFKKLNRLLKPFIEKEFHHQSCAAPNGAVSPELALSAAIRYFAGGSVWDIMISHGISRSEVYVCIWKVIDAVNAHPGFDICFPESHSQQQAIAAEFQQKSECRFGNCIGAIDGILIWMERPGITICREAGVDANKFFCGRKNKFGLNMQAVCDARRRFMDVSIRNPAATSDFLAFITSDIYQKVTTEGFLAPGLTLFGDNAYVNTRYMTTPFPNVSSGTKDDFNFYQSQLRINIECAFGILVNRWRILKSPLRSMSVAKVTALVFCLCTLQSNE